MQSSSEKTSNIDSSVEPAGLFFSRENTAQIGRFTIPFPFSAILSLLMIPVLFIAAGLSIPITFVARYLMRRREARFAAGMKKATRWISWEEANPRISQGGTFIEEYLSFKGPYRLWWAAEDIPKISPYACCFEELPWDFEEGAPYFKWCNSHFTNPESGSAFLVDRSQVEYESLRRLLADARSQNRCVSIGPPSSPGAASQ